MIPKHVKKKRKMTREDIFHLVRAYIGLVLITLHVLGVFL